MKREQIKMSDLLEEEPQFLDGCTNSLYKHIEQKQDGYDADKNSVDYNLIFQRKSDNKYFKVTYTQSNYTENDLDEQIATEVFPYTETVTKYK